MHRQESPGLREFRKGLNQALDADQSCLRFEVQLSQSGFLQVVPRLGEGSAQSRPTAVGRKIGPFQGHEGRIGSGPARASRSSQPEKMGMG